MLLDTNTSQLIHIILDVAVLLLFLYTLKSRKESTHGVESKEIIKTLEKTIQHTKEINDQFETTLSERKTIIEKLVNELDRKINTGHRILQRLEQLQGATNVNPQVTLENAPSNELINKILTNLNNGLSIDEVCSKYNKPRGEVELIGKLYSQRKPDH